MAKRTQSYGLNNPLQDTFPLPVIATRDPTTNDRRYELGQAWVNSSSNQSWVLTSVVANSATWALSSPGASDVDTLTGDGGGAIAPAAGNITLAGGTNVTTAGGGSTITFNLDATIVLATSVSSPIYTTAAADMNINSAAGQDILMQMGDAGGANKISFEDNGSVEVADLDSDGTLTVVNMDGIIGATTPAAGTFTTVVANTSVTSPIYTSTGAVDTNINSVAAQDIIIKMGDNAGVNKVSFTDSDDAEVFSIDSNGAIPTLAGLTIAGTFAQTAGTFSVGQDNAADAIAIGGGNTARVIGIANSAAAHVVTLGSTNGAASLDLQAGTGNFTIDGVAATTYNIGASTTGGTVIIGGTSQTGTMTLSPSDGIQQVDIANEDGKKTINIGNGVDGTDISIANGINTSAQIINIASGANAADSTVNIMAGIATAGSQTLNLASAASASVVTIGNATGATSVGIDAGSGGFDVQTAGGGDLTMGSNGFLTLDAVGTLDLNSSAGVINIGDNAISQNMNIGTAGARVITIGNVTGATGIALNAGTGHIAMATTGAGDVTIDSDDTFLLDADGIVEINSSAGVISIGNDADAQNMNFGTGAAQRDIIVGNATGTTSVVVNAGTGAASFGANATVHTTTVGSTSGAADTIIQSGTGNLTLTGTIEQVNAKEVNATGFDITMLSSPTTCTAADTAGIAVGTTGATNLLQFAQGIVMEQFIVGAGQTIIKPVMDASGLLCSLDLTATEGVEYNFGIARALSEYAFTIGTSAAFFYEVEMTLADVSGGLPYIIGFRKAEANNADYTAYTDYYSLGMITGTSAVNVSLTSELNGTGQNLQNSGDAWTGGDGGTTTLRVLVSAAGVCTATIDGAPPSTPLAYTFDGTDVVGPYIRLVHGAVAPGTVHIVSMRCGFQ